MLKLFRVLIALLMVLVVGLSAVQAQDTVTLGEVIEGEMTADEYEFEYQFEAEAGEVIAALFTDPEQTGNLVSPILILTNPAGDVIADTSDAFTFGDLTLFAEINSSGTYTLTVTRMDEEDGTDEGVFNLEIISVPVIGTGEVIEDSVSTEGGVALYAVRPDSEWAVSYVRGAGDMEVELTVNSIDSSIGTLEELALVEGEGVTEVVLGLFEEDETYIVRVGEPLFAFTFDEEEVEYTLEVLTFED